MRFTVKWKKKTKNTSFFKVQAKAREGGIILNLPILVACNETDAAIYSDFLRRMFVLPKCPISPGLYFPIITRESKKEEKRKLRIVIFGLPGNIDPKRDTCESSTLSKTRSHNQITKWSKDFWTDNFFLQERINTFQLFPVSYPFFFVSLLFVYYLFCIFCIY